MLRALRKVGEREDSETGMGGEFRVRSDSST